MGESGLVRNFVCVFFRCGFLRGFCEIWAVNAVFLWIECGELSGKDGLLGGWILGVVDFAVFGDLFWDSGRFAPLGNAGLFAPLRMTSKGKDSWGKGFLSHPSQKREGWGTRSFEVIWERTTATTNTGILRFAQNDDIKRLQGRPKNQQQGQKQQPRHP
jgi:hypothetical protein